MNNSTLPTTSDCWNKIGVSGDRSCPELSNVTHCRNCPIYSRAGRGLLEREAPANYVSEWTRLLADTQVGKTPDRTQHDIGFFQTGDYLGRSAETLSIIIFRLKGEWLAMNAALFKEVTSISALHTIPHRSNQVLLGFTNIRGELQMCISLTNLLNLEASDSALTQRVSPVVYERMMVIEREGNRWVFPVDEVYGVHRIHPDELEPVPANVSKSTDTYTNSMLRWQDRHVNYLDDELLFYTLNRRVL